MRLSTPCPAAHCGKPLEETSRTMIGSETLRFFKCGHAFSQAKIDSLSTLNLHSLDGSKVARPYQKEGVEFILDSGFNCVIGDQMRLGKTPQALLALKNGRETRLPCLILVRAANIYQWRREIATWYSVLPSSVWIIEGTKSWIPPGFDIYLMSMDTFSRRGTCKNCKHQYHEEECIKCKKDPKKTACRVCVPAGDSMSDVLLKFGFKLVIVDEAHSFKNTDSQRSQALTCFLKEIERSETHQEWTFTCPFEHQVDEIAKKFGLSSAATDEDIKQAFRKAAFASHPDQGGTSEAFRQVKSDFLTLSKGNTGKKVSWTENVTIKVDNNDAVQHTSKSSRCPVCSATVSQSAMIRLKTQRNCGVVMLTGTAIKNRADEYFVPLNLVAPEMFPSLRHFRNRWLEADGTGKYGRVRPSSFPEFKKAIAPFVLRREKQDIYTDLPSFERIFTVVEIEDENLKKAYNKVLDKIESNMAGRPNVTYFDSIGELQKLRRICGLAKVNWVADYVDDFLRGNEKAKLAVGYHHMSVRDALLYQLEKYQPLKLDGSDSAHQKDYIAHQYFEKSDKQLLLLGEQACKEGMELVYIENALVTERQWNAADEEQFEYRFFNPDKGYLESRGLKGKSTTVEYAIAKGTIDEFFYDLVEEKRKIMGETLGQEWSLEQDGGSFRQLLERTVAGRL